MVAVEIIGYKSGTRGVPWKPTVCVFHPTQPSQQQHMGAVQEFEKTLDKRLSDLHPVFEQAERQTGFRKTQLLMMSATLLVSLILSYPFPGFFYLTIATAYPILASARAANGHDKEKDVQWLAYWIIYSAVHFVEVFLRSNLLSRIPFYEIIRTVALVYLWAPQTKGALLVWHLLLQPKVQCMEANCSFLKGNGGSKMMNGVEKKRLDVAKTLNEIRNRASKSASEDD